ncbi:MAG: TRAP transporter small permease subunit [Rubrivivax sp.]
MNPAGTAAAAEAAPVESAARLPQGWRQLSTAIARVERALSTVACVALAAIMFIVVIDVSLRYVFNAPLKWGYDVISIYLVAAAFFLVLSDTLQQHGHIAVDILVHRLPRRVFHALQALGYGISAVIIAAIAWLGAQRLHEAYANAETVAAIYPWPTWIAYLMLAAGTALMALRCLFRAAGHAASAATGRELVETPPPPLTDEPAAPPVSAGV